MARLDEHLRERAPSPAGTGSRESQYDAWKCQNGWGLGHRVMDDLGLSRCGSDEAPLGRVGILVVARHACGLWRIEAVRAVRAMCGELSKTERIMRAWPRGGGWRVVEVSHPLLSAAYPASVAALANRCNLGVRLHPSHALFCTWYSAVHWRRSTRCTYTFRVLEIWGR